MSDAVLPVVYADETNNTGENLRDSDQPVFAVAGVHLDDSLAMKIVESVERSLQKGAGEPKYTLLSRRPRGRALLMSAFAALPENSVKVFVAEKNFMTIAKIIDLGLEPHMFDVGYNMYADESARSLAHLISIVGPAVGDRQKFDRVLDTFIEFVARSEHRDTTAYPAAVEDYLATVGAESRTIFRFALLPSSTWFTELVAERDSGLHLDTLDPAVPTIIAVCRAFTSILGPIRLVHDHSAVIARHAELLVNADQLPDLATAGGRPGPGPVGVRRVEFGNSHQIAQLKIADWAAGAARDAAMSKLNPPRKSVSRELDALVEDWLAAPPLWPDQDWLTDHLGMGKVAH